MDKQKILILEIDPPVDDISKRRKGFYERCGFTENSFRHIHPPYHRGNDGHDLIIMSCPKQISQNEYNAFYQYLQNRIMGNALPVERNTMKGGKSDAAGEHGKQAERNEAHRHGPGIQGTAERSLTYLHSFLKTASDYWSIMSGLLAKTLI